MLAPIVDKQLAPLHDSRIQKVRIDIAPKIMVSLKQYSVPPSSTVVRCISDAMTAKNGSTSYSNFLIHETVYLSLLGGSLRGGVTARRDEAATSLC